MSARPTHRLPRSTRPWALLLLLGSSPAWTQQVSPLSLGKGTDAKSRAEAAEFAYLSDAAKGSSYGIAAALIWAPQASFDRKNVATFQWDLAGGLNKNTVTGDKRADKLNLALGGRAVWDLAGSELLGRGALERRRNRISNGDESGLSLIGTLNSSAIKTTGRFGAGDLGYQIKPFPFAGFYRVSTSGNTGAAAMNGRYAGLVLGGDVSFDLMKPDVKGAWISLDISARRQYERWTSRDFKDASYDFGTIALRFPFDAGAGTEGAISLGHSRGTDRMAGEPWKRQTTLKLTIKFGSA